MKQIKKVGCFRLAALLFAALLFCAPDCSAGAARTVKTRSLRLLYWNVQCGMGEGRVDDFAEFVEWVKKLNPDIFVWCEAQTTESESPYDYMPRHLPDIAARYGHPYSSVAWRGIFPQAVTSKYPIEKVRRMVGAPPENYVTHGAGWFRVSVPGREINIVTLHLSPYQGEAYRLIEMPQILNRTIGASRAAVGDWVMLGDYNCYSARDAALYAGRTPEQIKAAHLQDVQVHDLLRTTTDYRDILFELRPDPEDRCTVRGRRRIDFIYGSPALADGAKDAFVVRDAYTAWKKVGNNGVRPSDHLPIIVDFELPDECEEDESPILVHARRELEFYAAKMLGQAPGPIPVTLAVDDALAPQEYRLETAGFLRDHVAITGGDPAGVLYGLYEYLERCCGVRWYSANWEKVPHHIAMPVPKDLDITGRPALAVRGTQWYEASRYGDFAAHLRLNSPVHYLQPGEAPWKGAMPKGAQRVDTAPAKCSLVPQPGLRALQERCRAACAAGAGALDLCGWDLGYEADFAELRAYLAAKWLWNPEAPYDELVDDFMQGVYGKAAPFVRAYLDRTQALKPVTDPKDLPQDFITESAKLFAQALDAVKDDPPRAWNVRRASLSLNYCRICREGVENSQPLKDFMIVWEYIGTEGQKVFNFLRDPLENARRMDLYQAAYYRPGKKAEWPKIARSSAGAVLPLGEASLARAEKELKHYAGKLFAGKAPECPITLALDKSLGGQAYRIRVKDGRVTIAGGDGEGALYGLYEYLERCCGVMWYSPECEHVPTLAVWPTPEGFEVSGRPGFAVRTALWNDILKNPEYAARLRLNGKGSEPNATVLDFATVGPRLMPTRRVLEMPGVFRKAFDEGAQTVVAKGDAEGRCGAFADLHAWVAARCLWDPQTPVNAVAREFMFGYYGKAAPHVIAFFNNIHRYQGVKDVKDVHERHVRDAMLDLDAAEEAVKDDPVRLRNVRRTALQLKWLLAHRKSPASEVARRELLKAREEIAAEGKGPLLFDSTPAADAKLLETWKAKR